MNSLLASCGRHNVYNVYQLFCGVLATDRHDDLVERDGAIAMANRLDTCSAFAEMQKMLGEKAVPTYVNACSSFLQEGGRVRVTSNCGTVVKVTRCGSIDVRGPSVDGVCCDTMKSFGN